MDPLFLTRPAAGSLYIVSSCARVRAIRSSPSVVAAHIGDTQNGAISWIVL